MDPYKQLVIGGPDDRFQSKLKQRNKRQQEHFANWKREMEKQGYQVDATNTAYKLVNGRYVEVGQYDPKGKSFAYDKYGATRKESLKARAASGNLATWMPDAAATQKAINSAALSKYPYLNQEDIAYSTDKELQDLNQRRMINAVKAQSDKLKIQPSYESMSGYKSPTPQYAPVDDESITYDTISESEKSDLSRSNGKGGNGNGSSSSKSKKETKKDKNRFPGGKDAYTKFEKSGARQSSARNSIASQKYLKKKRDKLKAGK